jgi:hypothetical protein
MKTPDRQIIKVRPRKWLYGHHASTGWIVLVDNREVEIGCTFVEALRTVIQYYLGIRKI